MARVGIYLALKNMIQQGQTVILSPYTIADVINMVLCAGGRPLFADIERETCNIDPAEVERLIDEKTGAVLITHLHGLAAPAHRIREICESRNVPLLEDAAQAFGAKENGRSIGTIGDAGIFSLGTYKNINAWYGGIVTTNQPELAESIRSELSELAYQSSLFLGKRILNGAIMDLASHPLFFSSFTFWLFRYGYLNDIDRINRLARSELDTRRKDSVPEKYLRRMTPLQAKLALSQLCDIEKHSESRIRAAEVYHAGLSGISELILPPLKTDMSHIYTFFPIQYDQPKGLLKWLMAHRRDIGAQHLKNCADLPGFSEFYRDCPKARSAAQEVILLPTYPRYSLDEVKKTRDAVCSFFDSRAAARDAM
jgi:dTDP-4-amino-4,6-dideoxygalactose transaminase